MTPEEAIPWVMMCPEDLELVDMYPGLSTYADRQAAWIANNRDIIREATTVLVAADPDNFAAGATVDRTGSLFEACAAWFYAPLYWNPPTIHHKHEGFSYTVTAPAHVAALHAMPSWAAALPYLLAHYDARAAIEPVAFTLPVGATFAECVLKRAPPAGPQGQVRYTLEWRKLARFAALDDMYARSDFLAAHFDLKEMLDVEGRVMSSERGADYARAQDSELAARL
ncbi:hypothetical protein B0H17DRAFT_1203993 [Mycena rosella]|uniref:Uncharacterized protein n=1 Tax=Mycena rosella TaxID=1033263 RepID=A0AAD7DAC0_MYCRO|nr:hypothetical protein B0H17DRAFT_1203993 [Mycena rosella]